MRQRTTGKQLQSAIIELGHLYGWHFAHFPTSRVGAQGAYRTAYAADGKGFPDLIGVHPEHGVVFVEVKGDGDRVRPEQEQWHQWLVEADARVFLWTTKNLSNGSIADVLRGDLL